MNLFLPQTLSVKSYQTNSKFGGVFLPPVAGVDFVDQDQNKA